LASSRSELDHDTFQVMSKFAGLLGPMEDAARRAGASLRGHFARRSERVVQNKAVADFVSDADLAAEAAIRATLEAQLPGFSLLMEESGQSGHGGDRMIVDPLDGTTNFLHGIPHFAVSIGAEVGGVLVAGVIYEPIGDRMYRASRGGGAWLGEQRLQVSTESDVGRAIFATGIPFLGRGDHPLFLQQLAGVMAVSAGVRRFGSAALDLAWVASGQFDGFWEADLKSWDLAAGVLLVEEAGGVARAFDGSGQILESGTVLATPRSLQAPLRRTLGLEP
jgi:myo-inositol-1(or 4)-monophosphatase